jgi:hypothetical protein
MTPLLSLIWVKNRRVNSVIAETPDSLNAQSVRGFGLMRDKQMHREQNQCSDPYNYRQHFKWHGHLPSRSARNVWAVTGRRVRCLPHENKRTRNSRALEVDFGVPTRRYQSCDWTNA